MSSLRLVHNAQWVDIISDGAFSKYAYYSEHCLLLTNAVPTYKISAIYELNCTSIAWSILLANNYLYFGWIED